MQIGNLCYGKSFNLCSILQLFNLRRDLQRFEPSPDHHATPSSNDDVVLDDVILVDDLDDGAGDDQGADGAGGLFEQSAASDVQVWISVGILGDKIAHHGHARGSHEAGFTQPRDHSLAVTSEATH